MNSFFPRTIPQWNGLDKDIAEAPSLSCFKNRLPVHLCTLHVGVISHLGSLPTIFQIQIQIWRVV